uniref:Uncharacterized protein n=1 Tax=Arundo donax TaxID=35708 RepID=A0A0A9QB85_ARUDO
MIGTVNENASVSPCDRPSPSPSAWTGAFAPSIGSSTSTGACASEIETWTGYVSVDGSGGAGSMGAQEVAAARAIWALGRRL